MSLGTLADLTLVAAPAHAREADQAASQAADQAIDIPAGPLSAALMRLSAATGISVGYAGDIGMLRAPRVKGRMSASEALRRMLRDSGFVAVQVGPSVFRLARAPLPAPRPLLARRAPPRPIPRPAPPVTTAPATPQPPTEIIVTGQKRPQILGEVAMSVALFSPDRLSGRIAPGARDLSLSVEGLALTNLGPGRNRQFIRGVADSPFIGPSQSTVAVVLDDARVTFDAPDPDLRLLDIERVEILKGPQGPLYGSGALGGIYHLVTRKPVLDAVSVDTRLLGETVAHGGIGFGGEAVVNMPIVADRLAIRAVGYASRAGGWIDDVGRVADGNRARTYGGRVALRWRPADDWTIDLGAVAQYVNVADSQYVLRPDTLRRAIPIAEPTDNDFRAASIGVEGRVGALKLVSATSYVDHAVGFALDASPRTITPARFSDGRDYTIFNQELRVSPASGGHWLIGASYLRATSHSEAVVQRVGAAPVPVETLDRLVTEYALFGEAKVALAPRLDLTAGLRLFRTIAEDEAIERNRGFSNSVGKTVLSPSVALSGAIGADTIVYLRYARSQRPGGLASTGRSSARPFDSDSLGTFDLGLRHEPAGGRLTYSVGVFHTDWNDIQSDYLLSSGLVSTRNAGQARITGAEASAEWAVLAHMRLSGGLAVQDGHLVRDATGRPDHRQLPIAPDLTARLGLRRDFLLAGWRSSVSAQGNYNGRSRLTFDENINRPMGRYATFSGGATFTRDALTLGVLCDNLFDAKGDSFAFGNPFSIRTTRQYTPLRPRTVTISIARSW